MTKDDYPQKFELCNAEVHSKNSCETSFVTFSDGVGKSIIFSLLNKQIRFTCIRGIFIPIFSGLVQDGRKVEPIGKLIKYLRVVHYDDDDDCDNDNGILQKNSR